MELLKNIGYNFLAQVIIFIAGLFSVPCLTRNLGAEGYGRVAFLLLLLNMFLMLDAFRPVFIEMNSLAKFRGREADYYKTAKTINRFFSLGIALAIFLLLNNCRIVKIDGGSGLYISLAAFFYFLASYPYANLCINNKTGIANLIRATGWVLAYGVFVILSFWGADLVYYAAVLAAAQAIIYVSYTVLKKRFKKENSPGTFSPALFKNTLNKFINNITFNGTVLLVSFIDRILVYRLCTIGLFGIYSVNYELGIRGNFISANITLALFPHLAKKIKTDPAGAMQTFSILLKVTVLLLLFFITPLAAYSEEIITIYAGSDFAKYSLVLSIVLAGVIINSLGFFGVALSNAEGNFRTQWICYLSGAALMLAIGYPLVGNYGLPGAAFVYLAGRFSDGLLFYITATRNQVLKKTGVSLLAYVTLVLPAFIYVIFKHNTPFFLLLAQGYYAILFWILCLNRNERERLKSSLRLFICRLR